MARPEHPLKVFLSPANRINPRWLAGWVLLLLAVSAALVIAAAIAMPNGYSWRVLSISESAAQGQHHAWIARLAFLCFGAAVLALAVAMQGRWARITCWMHLAFAVFMLGAAAFSHKPWVPGVPYDAIEDFLHSVCATAMGFAFSLGVAARFLQRGGRDRTGRFLDALALAAAIALPLLSGLSSGSAGLMQRVMFAIAYIWFGREAWPLFRRRRKSDGARSGT